MFRGIGRQLTDPVIRPAIVVWVAAYLFADISSWLQGHTTFGGGAFITVTLLGLGLFWTLLIDRLTSRLRSCSATARWAAVFLAVASAGAMQTLAALNLIGLAALTIRPEWQPWALNIESHRVIGAYLMTTWTVGFAVAVVWAGRSIASGQEAATREADIRAAASLTETAVLRLQLNPHFMFNSLNSLASMVMQDRKSDAEDMIHRLSSLLRATIDTDPMVKASLSDELELIESYLAIERMRFGDRLEVVTEIEEQAFIAMAPGFVMQPLVENAIKHGVAAVTGHWRVTLSAGREDGDLVLRVSNRLKPSGPFMPKSDGSRTGIGLSNLRQRLALAYGDLASLEAEPLPDGYRSTLRLPFTPAAFPSWRPPTDDGDWAAGR